MRPRDRLATLENLGRVFAAAFVIKDTSCINSKLPDVMKTAKSIKVKNDKMTNQINWLKHFQTKKFSSEP